MRNISAYDRVMAQIESDREELVKLCLDLGNTPSPHGKERAAGEKVLDWLRANGIDGFLQFITEESVNAVARLRGSGDGPSLIVNAHLDTGPEPSAEASEAARKIEGAWVDGDLIFGKGVINDKAQLCAFMTAAAAIKKAGVRLKGDLIIAAVAFETGSPSVDEYQGVNYPGEGFGTKWLVDRGVTADYALVGETSGFGIVEAECGAAFFKIRVHGRELYTPRLERGSSLKQHPNAFVKMAHVVQALERWATEYEKREQYEFSGGTIIPKAQVVHVRAPGGIGHPSAFCDIYFDVRLVPEKKPQAVQKELETLLGSLDLDFDIVPFQYSRGHIARNADPLIEAIKSAHRYVFGSEPPRPPSAEVSMWRDLNVFNETGIPSVCYGPPRQREAMSGGQNRAMKISDLVSATKVYALTILGLCGYEVAESRAR
ncbi:MAG TPA: M20/M25/M40 family metallo-hydrolase [Candidatus Eisenbacteria bacterium]|nr:M20/M25/M40 family metallo-hydrolase [Candidatus Eisenbacteria bacterium]